VDVEIQTRRVSLERIPTTTNYHDSVISWIPDHDIIIIIILTIIIITRTIFIVLSSWSQGQ